MASDNFENIVTNIYADSEKSNNSNINSNNINNNNNNNNNITTAAPANHPKDAKRPWYYVNTYMLPAKAGFLGAHGALGAYLPNAGVFHTSLGLTKSQTGIILGVRTLAEIIGNPMWGAVADKTRAPRWVFVFLTVMSICLVTPQPWIARRVERVQEYEVCKAGPREHSANATDDRRTAGNLSSTRSVLANASHASDCETVTKEASSTLFYTMLAVTPFAYLFGGSIPNAVDTRVLRLVQTSPVPATYGQQRYFGSISFGISSVISGLLADNIRHDGTSSFTAAFYWYGFSLLVLFLCSPALFKKGMQLEETKSKASVNVWRLVLATLRHVDVAMFFLTVLVSGIASGVLYGFLFIYLEELNVSKLVMGFNILLSCAVELLIFPFASKITGFLRGNRNSIALGLFMYSPRFFIISYVKNVWVILASHALHGICFALFWAAAVDQVYKVCPKEVLTTMLGILNSTFFGLGWLIAYFLGGFIYDALGGPMLFRLAAILCIIWSALWSMYVAFDYRRRNRAMKATNP